MSAPPYGDLGDVQRPGGSVGGYGSGIKTVQAPAQMEEKEGIFLCLAPATPPRSPRAPVEVGRVDEEMDAAIPVVNKTAVADATDPKPESSPERDPSPESPPRDPTPPSPDSGDEEMANDLANTSLNDEDAQKMAARTARYMDGSEEYTSEYVRSMSPNAHDTSLGSDGVYTGYTGASLGHHQDYLKSRAGLSQAADRYNQPKLLGGAGMARKDPVTGKWIVPEDFVTARTMNVEHFRGLRGDGADRQENNYAKIGELVLSLDDLKAEGASEKHNLDPRCKEMYLSDEDFKKIFMCEKEAFLQQKKWKQDGEKKKHGLF